MCNWFMNILKSMDENSADIMWQQLFFYIEHQALTKIISIN